MTERKDFRRRDTQEQRDYWDFIEKAAEQWRKTRPSWADPNEPQPCPHCKGTGIANRVQP